MRITLLLLTFAFCFSPFSAAQEEGSESDALREIETRHYELYSRSLQKASVAHTGVDVLYYRLNIRIADQKNYVRGDVITAARVTDLSLSALSFDLTTPLVVDSAFIDGVKTTSTAAGNVVTVALPRSYNVGEVLTSQVYYHGNPPYTGLGSYTDSELPDGTHWIYTLSEPFGARDWWPCIDHTNDKADSADIWITCRQNTIGVSNGKLIGTVQNPDTTRTFMWKHRYPIASYLIAVTIGNFNTFSDWYRYSPTDSLEIVNYVLPTIASTSPAYRTSAALTPRMMDIYSAMFGKYPFLKEKYGHVQFGWGGGMEHQTLTSLGSSAFTEATIAHELAHQWFGDLITCRSWPDLWLNEGFAQYFEAVYREKQYGMTSYWSRMQGRITSAKSAVGTLYVQDTANVGNLFASSRVYNKGAFVLQMLRFTLGDSIFFAAIRSYANDPTLMYGTAATADFRRHCELISGRDLGWFFTEWIYGERYPKYTYSYSSVPDSGRYRSTITISQTTGTSNPAFFVMPINLKFVAVGWDTTVRITNDAAKQTFQISLSHKPDTVQLDPEGWLLRDVTKTAVSAEREQASPASFMVSENYPNPFNPSTRISYAIPALTHVRITVFDLLGRELQTIVDAWHQPGHYDVAFDAGGLPSGIYLYRIQAGSFEQTKKMLLLK